MRLLDIIRKAFSGLAATSPDRRPGRRQEDEDEEELEELIALDII